MVRRLIILLSGSLIVPCFARPLEIQLPAETNSFKQGVGAELANAQCLICHSVEYVSIQPPMPRTFWKASVEKMRQKYGAAIPDDQVEPLTDYLTHNYGLTTNQPVPTSPSSPQNPVTSKTSIAAETGAQIATRYGCLGCHNAKIKIVGPAYREIAAKYKSDAEAEVKIQQQIHNGGSGKWGPIIMPPFPQVTPGETKVLTEWILGAN